VEIQIREALECYKWGLTNDFSVSLEDQNAEKNVGSKDCTHEILGGNKDSNGNLTRGRSLYILSKNVSLFYPCHETLCVVEFKGKELINLAEEVLRPLSGVIGIAGFF
jgi:hypothetical protein